MKSNIWWIFITFYWCPIQNCRIFNMYNVMTWCTYTLWKNSSHWVQFSSVAQSCLTLCDPMNHSRPSLPVHHQLPEFTQTHVHRISDAIQPSHPLTPSSFSLSLFQHRGLFSNETAVHIRWPKYWSFSFSISHSMSIQDRLHSGLTGLISLLSKGLSEVFSSTTVQRHQFFGALPSLWPNSHNCTWPLGSPLPWLYGPLSVEQCLCFSTHRLGLS